MSGEDGEELPTMIYVQWSDDQQHIRKWSLEPFAGAWAFVSAGNGAPLGPLDASPHQKPENLPLALRHVAQCLFVECERHVIEDAAVIVTDAAAMIESCLPALERIAQPVFVAEPVGTPDSPWRVALNERIEIAARTIASAPNPHSPDPQSDQDKE